MPKGQNRYWVVESHDPDWSPANFTDEQKAFIRCCVWKAEHPEHCSWHQHAYVEFAEAIGGKAVSEALGQIVRKKGDKGGHTNKNAPRRGTQAQAIGYVVSDEWCHECNTGDCNGAKWLFDAPYNLKPWVFEEHGECRKMVHKKIVDKEVPASHRAHVKYVKYKCATKGTCSPVEMFGTLASQGRGGKREGAGSGNVQQAIQAAIADGMSRKELFEAYPGYLARYHAWFDKAYIVNAPSRCWEPAVYWLWGDSETEKSRLGRAIAHQTVYNKNASTGQWWCGYDGQEVVVINDLRKGHYKFSDLLDLLDRYEYKVQIKGGTVQMRAKVFVITSNQPHKAMWSTIAGEENENLYQLTRRLKGGGEYAVGSMDDDEKGQLVYRMRCKLKHLLDPGNWTPGDAKYGDWDVNDPVPDPPKKRLKTAVEPARSFDDPAFGTHSEGCHCQRCVCEFGGDEKPLFPHASTGSTFSFEEEMP